MLKGVAQQVALVTAPAILAMRGSSVLDAFTTYSHILTGQGAGAGWDANEVKVAARLIRSEYPIVFDVGANNGKWSSELAKLLSPEASFHLFECAPLFVDALAEVSRSIGRAVHVNAAISDRAGTALLHYPAKPGLGGGLGSLHARSDVCVPQIEYAQIEAPTIRLDSYADENGIQTIDLLKMDIEGHELYAMQGAERLFVERRVKAMTFEFGSANVNSRTFFRDFWNLLTSHGFNISRIIPGGRLRPVERYSETLEYFRGATNYAAVLQGPFHKQPAPS